MLLAGPTEVIQVVTGQPRTVDVCSEFYDYNGTTVTPDNQAANITTATTTTVVSAPGSSVQRKVAEMMVRNKDASNCDVTVRWTDGVTTVELWKVNLGPGETLAYTKALGFTVL